MLSMLKGFFIGYIIGGIVGAFITECITIASRCDRSEDDEKDSNKRTSEI